MISLKEIEKLVETGLKDDSFFAVKVRVSESNQIKVLLDGDNGVSIKDCIDLSRHIEFSLDRESEDFSLEVSTPGVTEPLIMPRQFIKNVGREIKVVDNEGEKHEGLLKEANQEEFTIFYEYKERVEGKKKKIKVEKNVVLKYDQIKTAIIKVSFKK